MSSSATARMADFDLTDVQRQVRAAVREFAERELLPYVEEHEQAGRYPIKRVRTLISQGYLTPLVPEAYGGSEVDVVTYGLICEELARVDWVMASVVSVTNSLVAGSILRFGDDDQRQRWLPAICDGSVLTSACLTEPDGGTDLSALRTRAVPTDDGWRLTGSKVFISHAAHAGLLLVAATVDPSLKHAGVTVFLVDATTSGIGITEIPMRTLQRDNLAEVHFDDVHLPPEAVLGTPGGGVSHSRRGSRLGPVLGRRAMRRTGSTLHRPRVALRRRARGIWSAHRAVSDDPAEDRGHDQPNRSGACPRLSSWSDETS